MGSREKDSNFGMNHLSDVSECTNFHDAHEVSSVPSKGPCTIRAPAGL